MSHVWIWHATRMSELCCTWERVMPQVLICHVTRVKESRHTNKSRALMSHVTRMNESCYTYEYTDWYNASTFCRSISKCQKSQVRKRALYLYRRDPHLHKKVVSFCKTAVSQKVWFQKYVCLCSWEFASVKCICWHPHISAHHTICRVTGMCVFVCMSLCV